MTTFDLEPTKQLLSGVMSECERLEAQLRALRDVVEEILGEVCQADLVASADELIERHAEAAPAAQGDD